MSNNGISRIRGWQATAVVWMDRVSEEKGDETVVEKCRCVKGACA